MVRISSIFLQNKVWWRSTAGWRREKEKLEAFVFTGRATAGIAITQEAILRFCEFFFVCHALDLELE